MQEERFCKLTAMFAFLYNFKINFELPNPLLLALKFNGSSSNNFKPHSTRMLLLKWLKYIMFPTPSDYK